jgi:hypothetical protein
MHDLTSYTAACNIHDPRVCNYLYTYVQSLMSLKLFSKYLRRKTRTMTFRIAGYTLDKLEVQETENTSVTIPVNEALRR